MIAKKIIFKSSICFIMLLFSLGFAFVPARCQAASDEVNGAGSSQRVDESPSVAERIENAKILYNTDHKKEALDILIKIPRAEQSEETYLLISNIYSEMGNTKSAVTFLNRAIDANPRSWRAYYNLGVIYQKKNDTKGAIENYKKAISKNRVFAHSYYNLGCVYLSEKNYKAAKPNFIKAINLKPDEKEFYYNLAYTYKMLGDEKNAQKILDVYNKF